MGLHSLRGVLILTKILRKKKKKDNREGLIFLSSVYFYTGTLPRITWNQWSWLWLKSPYTHTQTKNGLHSRATSPKTIWNGLLTQKELLLGRDTAVLVNQYCWNRCLYHSLLFILHQESNSTWWSLGRKHNIANCFSRTEESRFMEEFAPKMHCNITLGVKGKRNVCVLLLTTLLTGQLFWRK